LNGLEYFEAIMKKGTRGSLFCQLKSAAWRRP
jgi:hypothetical protein